MEVGFSTEEYLKAQKKAIEERLSKFSGGRLYLEFGGKLLDDFHASRCLPGYEANVKLELLKSLGRKVGVIYCVSAKQLVEGKVNGNWDMRYDLSTLKSLQILSENKLPVLGVVINRYEGEIEVDRFKKRLERMGVKVYLRKEIKGYPANLKLILSKKGYGGDEYVETNKDLVVVWGAGPGSGKLSTCLGQIYLDNKRGIDSGYAKFETFPIWDLPLNHPVNLAYEAATADLGDFNLIDNFHRQAYEKKAVNYNRDMDAFPLIKEMFAKMTLSNNFSRSYKSPTDMGVNCMAEGIVNDKVVRLGSKKDIVLYWYRYGEEYKKGLVDKKVLDKMKEIMLKAGVDSQYLSTVVEARRVRQEMIKKGLGERGISCAACVELPTGKLVYGKNSELLHAEAAVVLNCIKELSGIADEYKLISKSVIKQIGAFKKIIGDKSNSLDLSETLLALAVSSENNLKVSRAIKSLQKLKGCYIHTTHKPSESDCKIFRKLGMWLTTDGMVEKTKNPDLN